MSIFSHTCPSSLALEVLLLDLSISTDPLNGTWLKIKVTQSRFYRYLVRAAGHFPLLIRPLHVWLSACQAELKNTSPVVSF